MVQKVKFCERVLEIRAAINEIVPIYEYKIRFKKIGDARNRTILKKLKFLHFLTNELPKIDFFNQLFISTTPNTLYKSESSIFKLYNDTKIMAIG